jgi:hypothetical protein
MYLKKDIFIFFLLNALVVSKGKKLAPGDYDSNLMKKAAHTIGGYYIKD